MWLCFICAIYKICLFLFMTRTNIIWPQNEIHFFEMKYNVRIRSINVWNDDKELCQTQKKQCTFIHRIWINFHLSFRLIWILYSLYYFVLFGGFFSFTTFKNGGNGIVEFSLHSVWHDRKFFRSLLTLNFILAFLLFVN